MCQALGGGNAAETQQIKTLPGGADILVEEADEKPMEKYIVPCGTADL